MMMSDLDRLLDATLPGQCGRLSVTLTDLPCETGVRDLLDKAADMATLKGTPLVEIHLPFARFPSIGTLFRNVPVRDCGRADVLRFTYDAQPAAMLA